MFAKYYAVGSRIQPERDYPRVGLERGELYEVVENGPTNHLTVRGATEKTIQFNPLLHSETHPVFLDTLLYCPRRP
jgi:hypothetical protein